MGSNTGVIVAKRRDKRDVLFVSTKHEPAIVDVNTKYGFVAAKPFTIIDYYKEGNKMVQKNWY